MFHSRKQAESGRRSRKELFRLMDWAQGFTHYGRDSKASGGPSKLYDLRAQTGMRSGIVSSSRRPKSHAVDRDHVRNRTASKVSFNGFSSHGFARLAISGMDFFCLLFAGDDFSLRCKELAKELAKRSSKSINTSEYKNLSHTSSEKGRSFFRPAAASHKSMSSLFPFKVLSRGVRTVAQLQELPEDEVRRTVTTNPDKYELRLVSSTPHAIGAPLPPGFALVAVPRPGSRAEFLANEVDKRTVTGTIHLAFFELITLPLRAVELTMSRLLEQTFFLKPVGQQSVAAFKAKLVYHLPEMRASRVPKNKRQDFDYMVLKQRFSKVPVQKAWEGLRKRQQQRTEELRRGKYLVYFTKKEALTITGWLFSAAVDEVFKGDTAMQRAVENARKGSNSAVQERQDAGHCYQDAVDLNKDGEVVFLPGDLAKVSLEYFREMWGTESIPADHTRVFEFSVQFLMTGLKQK